MMRHRPVSSWQTLARCLLLALSPLMLALTGTEHNHRLEASPSQAVAIERPLTPRPSEELEVDVAASALALRGAPGSDVERVIEAAIRTPRALVLEPLQPDPEAVPADDGEADALGDEALLPDDAPVSLTAMYHDLLWLARAIYSETDRPHEQELVAWVIRNRVETAWQGRETYREVVLAPFQFSAFNPGHSKRSFYRSLRPGSDAPGWDQALEIALKVYFADPEERPFPISTRHFYSEQALGDADRPAWATRRRAVRPSSVRVEPARFRFYDGVI